MLTIMIPTFSRNYFLTRKLHNLAGQKCHHKILILDSSPQEIAKQNASIIEAGKQTLDVHHYLLGEEVHWAQKLNTGIKEVTTPYVIMTFDDDFLNLNAVNKALSYLKTHPETVSVSGLVANFVRPRDSSFPVQRIPIPGKSWVFNDPHPFVRIEQFLTERRLRNPLFHLWRSEVFKLIIKPITKAPFRKYSEILFDHAATYAGPTVLLRELFEIRHIDYEKEKYRQKGLPNFRAGLVSELEDVNFSPMFSEMIDTCAQILESAGYGDKTVLRDVVGENYLRFRTRTRPLSYGPKTLCDKFNSTVLMRFATRIKRLLRLVTHCRSLSSIKNIRKLIKLYGRTTTIDMLENDPDLQLNYYSLLSDDSLDQGFVANVYETLRIHPEPKTFYTHLESNNS